MDEFVGAGQAAGVDQLFLGGLGIAPAEVVGNGAGKENIFLQNHGHLIPEDLQIILANIYAAHLHYALRGVVQPGNQLDQSGLG